MKKLFVILILLFSINAFSQEKKKERVYHRVGNELVLTRQDIPLKDTLVNTGLTVRISKIKYPVYKTRTGKYLVLRTSKKTGRIYKQYLKVKE